VTEPRDGAPDDPESEALDAADASDLEEASEPSVDESEDFEDGAPLEIDDEDIQDDLIDEKEAQEVDDYDAAVREVAGAPVVAPPPARPGDRGPRLRRRSQAATQRAPSPSEIAVHVREDWSRAFVILTVAVFTAILLNALLFGHGGFFTPLATPTPEPTESAEPSESVAPSESVEPSESAEPSESVVPSTSASASPS
jgi:hypothetical protein